MSKNISRMSLARASGAVILGLMMGCAGKVHKLEEVPVVVSPSDNPSAQINALEEEFSQSRKQEVPLLAPTWYHQASQSFSDAKELREKSTDMQKLFKKLAEAKIELRKANEIAGTSGKVLADVLDARQAAKASQKAAQEAGAVDLSGLKDEFTNADKQFLSLSEAVENNDMSAVEKGKGAVIASYLRSQGDATKKETLDVARRTIEEAKNQGAGKYAPKSLEFAEDTLKRAEKFISENPSNRQEIEQQSSQASFYANRALKTTLEAKNVSEKKPEQVALGTEASKARSDRRTEVLIAEAEKNRGAAERDARVSEVRKLFSPSEADVLRDGSKVILRLKDVKFASGRAELGQNTIALMSKVHQALALFKGSDVVIEGHTDSTGSDEVNNRLSQERADTVKQYLVSEEKVGGDKITAVGKGAMNPLTTNKTKEGRATNRRIDVVVDATTQTNNRAPAAE